MKRWQMAATILLPSAGLLLAVGQARAQSFDQLVNTVSVAIVKSGLMVDALLGYWVQGNALTTPGGYLAGALAETAVNTVRFLAFLVTMF
jgi:hypothetical protein